MTEIHTKALAYLTIQATHEGQAAHAHVHEVVQYMRDAGWEITLFQPHRNTGKKVGAVRRCLDALWLQGSLARRARSYDAIYIRNHPLAFPTAVLARTFGIPIVHECNGPYEDMFQSWPATRRLRGILKTLQRVQYRWASTNISVTPGLQDWINEETNRDDTVCIPNGARVDKFRPALQHPSFLPRKYALFFGALSPWQGLGTLLQAVESTEWPDDIALVIAGDGTLRRSVEAAARTNPQILYVGQTPYREIPAIIANAVVSIIVKDGAQHSKAGLSPLKLYESAACGRPLIVSDMPGLREPVESFQLGMVVPVRDPAAVARAVKRLADGPHAAKAMGDRARSFAVKNHSWQAVANMTSEVLDQTINEETANSARNRVIHGRRRPGRSLHPGVKKSGSRHLNEPQGRILSR